MTTNTMELAQEESPRSPPDGLSVVAHRTNFPTETYEGTSVIYKQGILAAFRMLMESVCAALQIALHIVLGPVLHRWRTRWGTSPEERHLVLPGDDNRAPSDLAVRPRDHDRRSALSRLAMAHAVRAGAGWIL